MCDIPEFKRGSTFTRTVSYVPLATDPVDLSSVTVTSNVKDGNGAYYTGAVTKAGDNLSFTVVITAAVSAVWPLGFTVWDVKFVYGGVTFFSDTETFETTESISI